MKIILIGLMFLFSPFFLLGHNPLSARYQLDAGENSSLLTINLSQSGLNQAMIKEYSKIQLDSLDEKEYKELIVEYIKSNFSLTIDQEELPIETGGIKLGDHQTDLKFVLAPILKNVKRIDINISAFKKNKEHQTIFFYHIYDKQDHVVLDPENNYKTAIQLIETPGQSNKWIRLSIIGVGLIIATLYFRKR
jgi:hypothetical protein